jgi:hypothetical protein
MLLCPFQAHHRVFAEYAAAPVGPSAENRAAPLLEPPASFNTSFEPTAPPSPQTPRPAIPAAGSNAFYGNGCQDTLSSIAWRCSVSGIRRPPSSVSRSTLLRRGDQSGGRRRGECSVSRSFGGIGIGALG